MSILNEITMKIVKNVKNGESILSLANKIGFAYSAVYKWVKTLQNYNVLQLIEKGNKTIIKINKNLIYKKFIELDNAVSVIEKDAIFWRLIKNLKLKVRFIKGTAVAIWTKGSYITGDFSDRIYFLEVYEKDLDKLKNFLENNKIPYSKRGIIKERPLICITPKKKFKIEKKAGLPVMPLKELVSWCKRLYLENILEQLDSLYNLKLKAKYAEISTMKNVKF
ncbi:hypothetical protein CMI37_07780 [Candidatus Pacearchaeota archaeon]|nr:hypothetical protein [Candidatus Pacearchaeota archaeon]|tara:strand:+ start:7028 stop:7693 length:666 start_codon:yes stop_codon:yes gene_type:complete